VSKRAAAFLCLISGGVLTACGHSYAIPVVATVQSGPDQEVDVAWIVEDGGRVIRCVNGPDRPRCRRADVD
jgi:hypothetical protein